METEQEKQKPNCFIAILGCIGGLFIHLIIGAYFQWGFINVYVTSYYQITQPNLRLESNGIVFPLMQLCIAPTMKLGHTIGSKIGTFKLLIIVEILIAGVVFGSSYIPSFLPFVFVFGIGIGSLAGLTFLIPLIQCNKYMEGYRMAFNGIILTGTGLGSMVFGQFVYNYVNPDHLPSNDGYYNQELTYIAQRVPSALRYLSLIYLGIGVSGALMLLPVIRANQLELSTHDKKQLQLQNPYICPSMCASLKTPVFYAKSYVIIFAVCGNLLLNGNFKTYVQKDILDDNFLTLIGTIGALGNAFCRFPWNMLFLKIGYRLTLAVLCLINTVLLITIRYTVQIPGLYCFMIFVANSCLGGFLVLNITHSHIVFGIQVGSDLDLFYWSFFSFSNFIGYFYVTFLSGPIGFNNIFYICMAMNVSVFPLLCLFHFESKWSKAQAGIEDDDTMQLHELKKQYDKKIEQIQAQRLNNQNQQEDQNPHNADDSLQVMDQIHEQNNGDLTKKITKDKLQLNEQRKQQQIEYKQQDSNIVLTNNQKNKLPPIIKPSFGSSSNQVANEFNNQ